MGYPRGVCVQSVLFSSIFIFEFRVLLRFYFSLVMQTLITSNNKESDKLQNLNVLRYYNASEMGGTNL